MTVGTPGDKSRLIKTAIKDAAEQACRPLEDDDHPLLVRYGRPSMKQQKAYDEIIGVTDVNTTLGTATVGPQRSLDATVTVEVMVSVWRPGDDGDLDDTDLEQECGDRAYELLDALQEWLRGDGTTAGNERTTLGGLVQWCRCTAHTSTGATEPEFLATGRVIEIAATFTSMHRITA